MALFNGTLLAYFEFVYLIDHILHIEVDGNEVLVQNTFLGINGRERIKLRNLVVLVIRFFLLDFLHVKVCLAETYKGFSDGNNKKEKAK